MCHGKMWDVALEYDGDRVVGAMPFHYVRRYGMTVVVQPQLTQFSGPVYFLGEGHSMDAEYRVARSLIGQMEQLRPMAVVMHTSPQITNWLPFYWEGYSQTTRYTYRIPDISNPERVFASFDKEKRQRKIQRTERQTVVRYDMKADDFAAFHRRYWESRGEKDILAEQFITRVCSTAIERGQGVIASLHDMEGNLLAARFVAYDNNSAYTLMSANDQSRHRSGHSETLMWALIKHLSGKSRAFDFEGSMDEGIEYFYRSFGSCRTPFFEIRKYRNTLVDLLFKSIIK